ncbi:MAG: amidohydrolase family protein [Ferruginibacter sp.]|nr:amidohydrolase family protein [Ferruginibacter sp.]
MKKKCFSTIIAIGFSFSLLAQIAIKAKIIYPVSGIPIRDGVILVKEGKIEKVGSAATISIPSGYTIYESATVTPGLIDARTVIGMSGVLNISTDQDQLEKSSPIQPDLRAIDAYNPDEKLVTVAREYGITTIHTGHGIGALISGQTMIAKTKKGTVDQVTIEPLSMLAMTLGSSVSGNFASPGTKAKQMAMIRTELIKAQAYLKKSNEKDINKRPAPDLKMDALAKLLKGEVKAMITANSSVDIMNAIRLADEFKLKLVIDGAAESYRLIDEIKKAKAEIILHASMTAAEGDKVNMSRETAAILTKAGVHVSIESGYESYVPKTRIVLFEAAVAMASGLSFDDALKSITINPAKLLGIDKRVGSIEAGKDADLVLYNGDPFEYVTNVCKVFIDGKLVSDKCNN